MSLLSSITSNANVAVIGSSGGIGRAFVELLAGDPSIGTIHAFSRSEVHFENAKVTSGHIDILNEETVQDAAAAASKNAPLDLVIVASGILHRGESVRPEKRMGDLAASNMLELFAINAAGPAIVAKQFLPTFSRDRKTVFAALSARVGSIGDNRLGGWASYRASKAALNMLVRTHAIEHARRWPESVVVALHPGTVETQLSNPFSSGVPSSKLFSPAKSAEYLLNVINGLTAADSGGFYAWDGSAIEF